MKSRLLRGVMAGFTATLVISLIMVLRLAAGIIPWYNPIEVMNLAAQDVLGTPDSRMLAWGIHFAVGTLIWGLLFALLVPYLPGRTPTRRGLEFGVASWLVVMLTVFPLAGSGLFGLGLGLVAPLSMLIAHLIFGAVIGAVYGWGRGVV
ncbi:hypothetical protein FEI13_09435 [Halomonas urmiana]|uniref:DUF2938 domain-containing protein n=1 Tax=Halomonas urmiana TaxID=490901 RepID=A0A5R8MGN0_9GAMM|nr:DUF6789 family protein [Halomonas urmiana]TLF50389.1 hypothetical protein FEI13_09435 [Halomonas urmiana]